MRARQTAEAARRALEIRRIQEHAALDRYRVQAVVEADAQRALNARQERYAHSHHGWREALSTDLLDPMTTTLWARHSDQALKALRAQEGVVEAEAEVSHDRRDIWQHHLRLADAARSVERRATRVLLRQGEEQALRTAEDLFRGRREEA